MAYEIVYYERPNGKQPARAFINQLADVKARARIFAWINYLAEEGTLPGNKTRKLAGVDELWEIRATAREGETRVFYSIQEGRILLLLSGFLKKAQKTPERESKRALAYLKDYKERHHG